MVETPVERIHEVLEVGIRAPLLVTRMLLPGMVKKGTGKILQISAEFGGPHDGVGWVPSDNAEPFGVDGGGGSNHAGHTHEMLGLEGPIGSSASSGAYPGAISKPTSNKLDEVVVAGNL